MHQFAFLFRDLKVIELATALAGPATGTFLQELGAQVIKIEPPLGDVSRSWKNTFEDPHKKNSIYYDSVNGNKNSLNLDLKTEAGQKALKKYLLEGDIVITNLSHRKAFELGLTYSQLVEVKSNLILANITGYGPWTDKLAFDMMIQADAGILSMTGHPDGRPAKIPIAIADILASHQLRAGILCSLMKREKTGEGSEIQVTLIDSMLSALLNQAGNYLMGNQVPQPLGTLHPSIAPYGDLFITSDNRWILLAIGSEKQFANFCLSLDSARWLDDNRYNQNQNRVLHREALSKDIQPIIQRHPASFWLNTFQKHGVPAALIRNLQEVFEDVDLKHLLVTEVHDGQEIKRLKTVVF